MDQAVQDLETGLTSGDVMELRMWLRLMACTSLISREVRAALTDKYDITLPRFDALAQLERSGSGLTMGQLSKRMMVTNGNVTGVVDRLVKDGQAKRVPVPGDRRALVVKLTAKGRREFSRMTKVHHARLHELLDDMEMEDLNQLYDMLGTLKNAVLSSREKEA